MDGSRGDGKLATHVVDVMYEGGVQLHVPQSRHLYRLAVVDAATPGEQIGVADIQKRRAF